LIAAIGGREDEEIIPHPDSQMLSANC